MACYKKNDVRGVDVVVECLVPIRCNTKEHHRTNGPTALYACRVY